MSEIVITGIGVISSLGVGKEAFWEGCRTARSGIKRITSFETSALRSNIAGHTEDFEPGRFMPPGAYRRMSRISRMAVASSVEAVNDSGLVLDEIDKGRVAVIMGTSYGSTSHVEGFYLSLLNDGPRGAQPFLFPETVPNAPASHVAMFHGIAGPNSTFCQNEISAETAIFYARNLLLQNHVDVALVGGADELSLMEYSCYDALGALNKIRVEDGEIAAPPIGGGRVLGEGAGILVMERLDFARHRHAGIYGRLASCVATGGMSVLGHYEADGAQMARAAVRAIEEAGLGQDHIDQVHVSANFTGELDRMEYHHLTGIFGKTIKGMMVSPLKYLMGDFGGAGAVRAAAILLSLRYESHGPAVKVEALKGGGHALEWTLDRPGKPRNALMTTSTFGGGSASLVFTKE
jgi:3-oxoacyl-[acyl-carrier-protein] synthase II